MREKINIKNVRDLAEENFTSFNIFVKGKKFPKIFVRFPAAILQVGFAAVSGFFLLNYRLFFYAITGSILKNIAEFLKRRPLKSDKNQAECFKCGESGKEGGRDSGTASPQSLNANPKALQMTSPGYRKVRVM